MERIGLSFFGGLQPTDIVDCVQLADELGYESAWMAEGHGGDQFSILTACALNTKNILLGTGITSVFGRTAPTIAMAAASVDHFSGSRFQLGLGTSHKVQVEPEQLPAMEHNSPKNTRPTSSNQLRRSFQSQSKGRHFWIKGHYLGPDWDQLFTNQALLQAVTLF